MSDIKLYQTPDGAEINILLGDVEMTGGNESAAIISLTCGDWWGNALETTAVRKTNSAFARVNPVIPANLTRLSDAAKSDLAWLDRNATVKATMPERNRVRLDIELPGVGETIVYGVHESVVSYVPTAQTCWIQQDNPVNAVAGDHWIHTTEA